MKSKREWIKLFKNEQVGHAIDAKQAYKSSITEAKDFYEHGIIHEGDTVLDLGSGNGRQAIGLTDYSLKRYVGIEPIKQSVDFSNMAFQDMENYEFIWMDLQNDMYNPNGKIEPVSMKIPFDEDYFDAVIAGSLFTHLGTVDVCRNYLAQIYRVLKPGGRIFCSWFRCPPNKLHSGNDRTVFSEGDILEMVTEHFRIYYTRGGMSDDYNDQWCIYGTKVI